MPKKRLDQLVLDRGLAPTRAKAQALIMAGEISVNGAAMTKPGHGVAEDAPVSLISKGPKFVSRGGLKLAGALDHFHIAPKGLVCLDVGASTGGFTDCLLQRGAGHVYAIDVGKGQLDPKIRSDSRVTWREKFHARHLRPDLFPHAIDLAVVDVSFISLRKVLPFVIACLGDGGRLLALIKPQFEASRKDVTKGGVLRDETKRQEILESFRAYAPNELGLTDVDISDAVISGPKGNREAFLYGRKPAQNRALKSELIPSHC
ncbi:MAG: TlyA family RNA methyltransferase [Pseudomonadota bacterium]